MALTRALNKLICRVLIGVFLLAQLAVAGYACPSVGVGGQQGAAAMAQSGSMPADCEHMDRKASNLCAEHCKQGQQTSDTAPAPVAIAPAAALLYVLPELDVAASPGIAPGVPDPLLLAAPPPHAILHCVLRI